MLLENQLFVNGLNCIGKLFFVQNIGQLGKTDGKISKTLQGEKEKIIMKHLLRLLKLPLNFHNQRNSYIQEAHMYIQGLISYIGPKHLILCQVYFISIISSSSMFRVKHLCILLSRLTFDLHVMIRNEVYIN